MIDYLVRALKRFAVLIPGLVIAYFSVRNVFPWFDKKLPITVALFLTYIVGAYLLIPALIRLIRIIVPTKHLQAYCVTPDGFASDPINIGIVGSRQQMIDAMKSAGWEVADDYQIKNLVRAGLSVIFNRPYPTAPMSRLYLFGRKQDIGFEITIAKERGQRHHVRFWATDHHTSGTLTVGNIAWHTERHQADNSNTLWVGAASRDIGFAFIRHNVQITHMIDADTDAERRLIVRGLKRQNTVASTRSVRLRRPYQLVNRALHGSLHSDGRLEIVRLK